MTVDAPTRILGLRRQIAHHDSLYYRDGLPEISDTEYDELMRELADLERQYPDLQTMDSPTQKVGGATIPGFTTIPHRIPMLSLENAFSDEELAAFFARVAKKCDPAKMGWGVEYKVDGVSLSLIYEKGVLMQALTRGDGHKGDDVTHNARCMRGVPLRLIGNPPPLLEIRGEAYITNSDFQQMVLQQTQRGEEPFKNSRNAAAGALKLRNPLEFEKRGVRFMAHSRGATEGQDLSHYGAWLESCQHLGVPVVLGKVVQGSEAALEYAKELADQTHLLNFEVDGIVIKADELEAREKLGATTKYPRWAIAYKWEKYEAATTVESIDVQVGKTGALTPVANLKPVEIAGTTVSRASLHNADEIARLGIQVGDTVVVEKAGKIIPRVMRVDLSKRQQATQAFVFPTKCPECQTDVVQEDGGVYVRCPNSACAAQLREGLRFYASRAAMDIEGLGDRLIEQLVEANLVSSLSDLYWLREKRDQIIALDRQGEKSADNLLEGIEASRQRPLKRLLTALNIRHVGTGTGRRLADHFGTLDAVAAASVAELSAVDDIGEISAQSIHAFFRSEYGAKLVAALRAAGLNFGSPPVEKAVVDSPITGKTLVVTGTLSRPRDAIHELILAKGGKPGSSVSKKTDYLVVGEDAGSKLTKAQELGVKILTEDEFMNLIGEV